MLTRWSTSLLRSSTWYVQFLDKVVDTPVGVQRQVFAVTVQKTAEVPHLQFIDKVLTVPVDNFLLWRLWRWRGGFAVNCGIFRTPSSWTSSARLAATFLSPRWPTVVGRQRLPCCAAVFLDSISSETSLSISRPHHNHHHNHHNHHNHHKLSILKSALSFVSPFDGS